MNKEQMIKEARTIEAMKKGYMGLEGKFGVISKHLGNPIISQGKIYFEQNFLYDPYEENDENELLSLTDDDSSYEVGVQFDGLSRGINFSIYIQYHMREITCRYNGNIVYKEMAGELESYVPDENWENKIEDFFVFAKKMEKHQKPLIRQAALAANEKKKQQILKYFKEKWGLDI